MATARIHRLRRPLVAVPVLALIGGAFWLGSRAKGSPTAATSVIERTVAVTSGPMRQTVTASGTLAPADTENLAFAVSGKVTAVDVTAGQKVTKGTVLATVDSAALRSQVTQAQATLDSASARVATDAAASASAAQMAADNANVSAAQAALADAEAALAGASLTAPIDGTVSVVNLTVGQQLGSGGTSGTALSGTGTGSGRSSAGASAGSAGSSAAGVAGALSAAGSSGSATQIQLISTGSYVVDLNVDDTQIGVLKSGQPATVTRANAAVASGGRPGRGVGQAPTAQVGASQGTGNGAPASNAAGQAGASTGQPRRAAPSASATGVVASVGSVASSSSGVSSFPVVVTVDGDPAGFFAGATVEVSITYNQLEDVLQVPTAAITQQNGQSFVTVVDGTKRVQTPVKTGLVSGGQTEILSGVSVDQQLSIRVTVPAAVASTANRNGGGNGGTGGLFTNGGNGGNGGGRAGGGFVGRAGD